MLPASKALDAAPHRTRAQFLSVAGWGPRSAELPSGLRQADRPLQKRDSHPCSSSHVTTIYAATSINGSLNCLVASLVEIKQEEKAEFCLSV